MVDVLFVEPTMLLSDMSQPSRIHILIRSFRYPAIITQRATNQSAFEGTYIMKLTTLLMAMLASTSLAFPKGSQQLRDDNPSNDPTKPQTQPMVVRSPVENNPTMVEIQRIQATKMGVTITVGVPEDDRYEEARELFKALSNLSLDLDQDLLAEFGIDYTLYSWMMRRIDQGHIKFRIEAGQKVMEMLPVVFRALYREVPRDDFAIIWSG